mgnify:CR=1 FL=1
MIKFGYSRISTSQQSLNIQHKALCEAGVDEERIYSDKKSGKNMDREGLISLCDTLEALHKAKISDLHLYIKKMDRLGRSTVDMLGLVEKFNDWGVTVHFMDDGISTGSTHSELVMTIISAIATAERLRINERCNEGRMEAMASGLVKFGAKRSIDRDKVLRLHAEGKQFIRQTIYEGGLLR